MRVLLTWIFTYEQFKSISVITDILTGKEINEITGEVTWSSYLTVNHYPTMFMITIYKVIENGNEEYYIHRPSYTIKSGGGSSSYKDVLLKVPSEQREELKKILE